MQTTSLNTNDYPKRPLASFIITDKNVPATVLAECIKSITALSLAANEREIIVVDDGSTVSPINELLGCSDEIVYVRQPHKGTAAARNAGMRISTGHFIQFLGGADTLVRAPYEHCLDITRYHDPEIVVFNKADKHTTKTPFTYDGPQTGGAFMKSNSINADPCTYIFKRSILGSLTFDESLSFEDRFFTPQLFLRAERLFSTSAEAVFESKAKEEKQEKQDTSSAGKGSADLEKIIFQLQSMLDTLPDTDKPAMNRQIAQMAMEYLSRIIKEGKASDADAAIERLKRKGLFPLPEQDYSMKYKLFRKTVGNRITRRVLSFFLK